MTTRWPLPSLPCLALGAALAACGSSSDSPSPPPDTGDAGVDVAPADGETPDAVAVIDGARCTSVEELHPDEGAQHVPLCAPVTYRTNPPSSGNHYQPPNWAAYKTYTQPVPTGFWVHNLEHGAVVISYNCPDGCADEVALAQSFIDALPPDPSPPPCLGTKMRVLLTPNPDLDVRFAASAWRYTLKADCFDPGAMAAFVTAHHASAVSPEPGVCGGGLDPFTAGPGGGRVCPQ